MRFFGAAGIAAITVCTNASAVAAFSMGAAIAMNARARLLAIRVSRSDGLKRSPLRAILYDLVYALAAYSDTPAYLAVAKALFR